MKPNIFTFISRQARAGTSLATLPLLLLGGCVTCPDGSVGTVCYAPAPYQYGAAGVPWEPGAGVQTGPQYAYSDVVPSQAGPVYADPTAYLMPETGARPGHEPGVGLSYPLSPYASNIGPADTRSPIAPTLPTPPVGPVASPRAFLITAREALASGRTGEAQEAMERAQTRLLDRATPLFQTDRPSDDPAVAGIAHALHALGAGEQTVALQDLDAIIPTVP